MPFCVLRKPPKDKWWTLTFIIYCCGRTTVSPRKITHENVSHVNQNNSKREKNDNYLSLSMRIGAYYIKWKASAWKLIENVTDFSGHWTSLVAKIQKDVRKWPMAVEISRWFYSLHLLHTVTYCGNNNRCESYGSLVYFHLWRWVKWLDF